MMELPPGVVEYRRTPTFTEHTVPAGLLKSHTTKAGVWGRIVVEEGALWLRVDGETLRLVPGVVGIALPEQEHEVAPDGAVRFHVEFCSTG
jgi:tellurite resistance-related uncharacterized protein